MDKALIKSILYNYEVRIASVVASGVINRAPKLTVLNQVRKEILRLQLDELEKNEMWKFAISFYRQTIAGAGRWREPDDDAELKLAVQKRAEKVYTVLKQNIQVMEHQKNTIADSIEFRIKHQMINGRKGIIEANRASKDYSPFFVSSYHKNCAEGHKKWQGRLFYDSEWKMFISPNDENYDLIENFIVKHQLFSIQWVTGPDVFLLTRRNCTHFFKTVSIKEALDGTYHIPVQPDRIEAYKRARYMDYVDRNKMLKSFKKNLPKNISCKQLNLDIKRANRLEKKWKN